MPECRKPRKQRRRSQQPVMRQRVSASRVTNPPQTLQRTPGARGLQRFAITASDAHASLRISAQLLLQAGPHAAQTWMVFPTLPQLAVSSAQFGVVLLRPASAVKKIRTTKDLPGASDRLMNPFAHQLGAASGSVKNTLALGCGSFDCGGVDHLLRSVPRAARC